MNKSNKKVSYRLTVLAIFVGILIIVLFHVLATNHINRSAKAALYEVSSQTDRQSDKILPDVYFLHTGEEGSEDLFPAENDMIKYYLINKANIPLGEVQKYKSSDDCIFFMPLNAGAVGEEYSTDDGMLLVYVDVSFESDLVVNTTRVLIVVMLFISVLLYIAGRRTSKALDDKERSMKVFFANFSHELKTPLMAIHGYAEGIGNDMVEKGKGCEIIVKEAERMASLVGDILELSKVDSGMASPKPTTNDVREIIYDALGIIEPLSVQKNIIIDIDLPDPLMAQCDEQMIFSAISNVLTNSVRYAKYCIEIGAHKEPGIVIVRITDDGGSLTANDSKHIFDRFYKGKNGQAGIGMALAREYARLHHGDIAVTVMENKTLFEIKLPTIFGK